MDKIRITCTVGKSRRYQNRLMIKTRLASGDFRIGGHGDKTRLTGTNCKNRRRRDRSGTDKALFRGLKIKTWLGNGVFRNCKEQSNFYREGIGINNFKKFQDGSGSDFGGTSDIGDFKGTGDRLHKAENKAGIRIHLNETITDHGDRYQAKIKATSSNFKGTSDDPRLLPDQDAARGREQGSGGGRYVQRMRTR